MRPNFVHYLAPFSSISTDLTYTYHVSTGNDSSNNNNSIPEKMRQTNQIICVDICQAFTFHHVKSVTAATMGCGAVLENERIGIQNVIKICSELNCFFRMESVKHFFSF